MKKSTLNFESNLVEGVFYVAPSGIVFNKETIDKVVERLQVIAESVAEALNSIADKLIEIWGNVQTFVYSLMEPQEAPYLKARKGWVAPKDTSKPSQVRYRKPMRSNIRSHC